jgi:methionyl-tRNA formyltransferase
MRRINEVTNPFKKTLFLGYDEDETSIIDSLIAKGCRVDHTKDKIQLTSGYDFAFSFGYRHIIGEDIIKSIRCPILNLHMSYLPYNRGAHPNFWSFFDNTPSGVTIHIVDGGVDTGPIVLQKYVNFTSEENTFSKTYESLFHELETLFKDNLHDLLSNNWTATKQRGAGSHHRTKDLPRNFSGWNADIKQELQKLHAEGIQN